jgi:hypothetical protein
LAWRLAYVVPNALLSRAIENDWLAITPSTDPRVLEIIAAQESARVLLTNFTDQFGTAIHPAVILRNSAAPPSVDAEALIAFRNAWAVSTLTYGWSYRINSHHTRSPLWADFFEIYPITVRDEDFISRSPAFSGIDEPAGFRGQTSPLIRNPSALRFDYDTSLFAMLLRGWGKRFIRRQFGWKTSTLFRSLAVAFQACRAPFVNRGTIYDHGTKLALWVSAFETLAHPRPGQGDANLKTVIDLLKLRDWSDPRLNQKRYSVRYRNQSIRCGLIPRLYGELYKARNRFLHGNKVAPKNLFPFNDSTCPQMIQLAPLIYRAALDTYCQQFIDRRRKMSLSESIKVSLFICSPLERAVLKCLV